MKLQTATAKASSFKQPRQQREILHCKHSYTIQHFLTFTCYLTDDNKKHFMNLSSKTALAKNTLACILIKSPLIHGFLQATF